MEKKDETDNEKPSKEDKEEVKKMLYQAGLDENIKEMHTEGGHETLLNKVVDSFKTKQELLQFKKELEAKMKEDEKKEKQAAIESTSMVWDGTEAHIFNVGFDIDFFNDIYNEF